MSKILITGGAGFIGSNLCDYFVNAGHEVICLDNFSTGHISNIQHLIDKYTNFQLIEGDIRNFETCLKASKGVDYILHEAALGSIPRSINDPITTNDVNICGFLNMLVAARDCNVKRFVFAASSSTYGDSTELPKVEERIGKPLSPYALTKYVDELYADVFSKTYGTEYIGLRYFNVFGKRQDPDSMYAAVIPLFIRQLFLHKPPHINGDGSITRDFTYIDNVVKMNVLAIEIENKSAINQVYNTAGGEEISILQLANNLIALLSKFDDQINLIRPEFGDARKGDIQHSKASIEKARRLLGYEPVVTFIDGLKETVNWYNQNIKRKYQ